MELYRPIQGYEIGFDEAIEVLIEPWGFVDELGK